MSPELWVVSAFGAGVLAVAWRAVEGTIQAKRRTEKAQRVGKALEARVAKLEMELSRLPESAVDVGALEHVEKSLREENARCASKHLGALERMERLEKTLITREAAERIVNQVNAVTQDVVALKEWQQTIEQTDSLEDALLHAAKGEKR